jgi:hypothetical protein
MIRTPDQRVRVFVSSTLGELAAERQAVTAAITRLRLTPVLFELGARLYPPRDLNRAYLQQSDVLVGVYAESYGWVAPGMEVSGLEDEYRLSAGTPRLIYTKNTGHRQPRLARFPMAIEAEGAVSYRHFDDAGELGTLVADDLALLLADRFTGPAGGSRMHAKRWLVLAGGRASAGDRRPPANARARATPCWRPTVLAAPHRATARKRSRQPYSSGSRLRVSQKAAPVLVRCMQEAVIPTRLALRKAWFFLARDARDRGTRTVVRVTGIST